MELIQMTSMRLKGWKAPVVDLGCKKLVQSYCSNTGFYWSQSLTAF